MSRFLLFVSLLMLCIGSVSAQSKEHEESFNKTEYQKRAAKGIFLEIDMFSPALGLKYLMTQDSGSREMD